MKMYALHPGSLPPKDPRGQRVTVTAEDLVRLYGIAHEVFIVWDPQDPMNAGLDWFDFIHLYPSYYGHYTLFADGRPSLDVPIARGAAEGQSLKRRKKASRHA